MADKTTGGLDAVAEAAIGSLPGIADLYDDTLLPVEQQGEARRMTGAQWKAYAQAAAGQIAKGPKGDPGDTGPQGPKGDTGDTGPQGAKGDTGDTGPRGQKGNAGETGPQGVGIQIVAHTAGDGSPGTTDTYTITLTNGSTSTFTVYNGANGTSFTVLGRYDTYAALKAAHPTGNSGDAWAVGSAEDNELLKCLLTENRCYKTGAKIKPKGVMVHSTGANNPNLRRYVQPVSTTPGREELLAALAANQNGNHWNRPNLNACVHAFIGKLADGSVAAVQTLPWDHRGWHAGNGTSGRSANDTHISFEICEDGLTDPVYFRQVYQAAVELTAMLCRDYGLDPLGDGVVICHQDGYKRGIASNHGDVYNWFPRHGKTMINFRVDVARAMEGDDEMTYEQWKEYMDRYRKELSPDHEKCWAEKELAAAVAAGITDGKRPHDFVTREEAAIMALRSGKRLVKLDG